MDAPVGAFVEEVAPRRVVPPKDLGALLLLVAASLAIHGWLLAHTCVTARDSIRFARTALNLEHPGAKGDGRTFVDVLRDAKECPDPPGFPLAVLATSKIVRMTADAPLPEQMLTSAQVASCLAAALLVLPSYWLGRLLFARRFAGFAGALLFQALPTVAHITADGLSDSSSLLCAVTALLFAAKALRQRSTKWFLAAGLASGCGYLVRPEGMVAALALGAVTAALALKKTWPRDVAIGRMTALLAGLLIVAGPYMALIGGVSNKPTVNDSLKKLVPLKSLMSKNDFPKTLLAEWYQGDGSQAAWALKAIAKESVKAAHYAPAILGLIGILMYRKSFDPAFAVALAAGAMQIGLLFALAMKSPIPSPDAVPPYVSERHTLLLVFLACLFTGGLLVKETPLQFLPRRGASWGLLLALLASALPAALKPLHENRAGHYHAGQFLAGKIESDHALIDPFEWAHWYSGRSLHGVPGDPPDDKLKVRWVVWEPTAGTKQNPHSRLPRLEAARQVVQDGANPPTLVYQWPENVAPELAKVVIYKQIIRN